MLADGGEQDGNGKPEAYVYDAEAKIDQKSPQFCGGRDQAGGNQPYGSDQQTRSKDHNRSDKDTGKKFTDNDIVTVQGLAYQPVQRPFSPFAVDGVETHKNTDKGSH